MGYCVYGYVYGPDCNPVKHGKVYPYFKQVDSNSSPSKWADEPYQIDTHGYYSFNLNDTQFLGVDGVFKPGIDKIYIAYVYNEDDPSDEDRTSLTFTHCCFVTHLIQKGVDVYRIDVTLLPKRKPIVDSYSLPPDELLTKHTYTASETSYPDYSWVSNPCVSTPDLSQKYTYDLVEIFPGHVLLETVYDWGDGTQDTIPATVIDGTNSTSASHVYTEGGKKTICIYIKQKWNTEQVICKEVNVRYNPPNVDFHWTPDPVVGPITVTFINDTTDLDNRSRTEYTYTWTIEDTNKDGSDNTQTYEDVKWSFQPQHVFATPGTKNITLTCKWFDGIEWQETSVTKQIVIQTYPEPDVDFHWTPTYTNDWEGPRLKGQELITFINDTSDPYDRSTDVYTYKWTIEDTLLDGTDNTKIYDNVDHTYQPQHAFQSPGTKTVKLLCYWNDGWYDHTKEVEKTLQIYPFNIVPDFTWTPDCPINRAQDVTFNPDSTYGDTDKISRYDWVIVDYWPPSSLPDFYTFSQDETSKFGEGSPDNTQQVDNTYHIEDTQYPTIKYHTPDPTDVTLTITYWDGWQYVTKSITKTVNKCKYELDPDFTATNWNPLGREEKVCFTNTTHDPDNLQYFIDWHIEDYYSVDNLDNPNPGQKTDNSEELLGVPPDTQICHHFQSPDDHDITLVIYFDNGWQRERREITKTVHPQTYPAPTPDFYWTPEHPISRDTLVTFHDNTSDPNNRCRYLDWQISDYYDLYNPDNPDYGNSTPDNSTSFIHKSRDFTPTHYFQSYGSHNVTMRYYYDDGFAERYVDITKTLTTDKYVLQADFTENPLPDYDEDCDCHYWVGQREIEFINTTSDPYNRQLDVNWKFVDPSGISDDKAVEERNDRPPDEHQFYTWQYPSRKPFSADNGATSCNPNKQVTLTVRYDDGWIDQAFTSKTKTYEARPCEISASIWYECNVDNYNH